VQCDNTGGRGRDCSKRKLVQTFYAEYNLSIGIAPPAVAGSFRTDGTRVRLRNSTASATEHTRCQARSQRRASACSWGLLIECCSCLMWIQSTQARNRSERTDPALTTEKKRVRDEGTTVGLRTFAVEIPPKPSCNNWSSECSECSQTLVEDR
jgi:hypothetical protein